LPVSNALPLLPAADDELPADALPAVAPDAGLAAPHDAAWLQALQDAAAEREAQAYARGLAEGEAAGRQAEQAALQPLRVALQRLQADWQALTEDPQRFHQPLRRLALHLAEQLLRTELHASGQALDRLVQQALGSLGPRLGTVTVSLHPDDQARLLAWLGPDAPAVDWQPDAALRPGSVRLRMNDTVVDDLIEHRLEAMARQLLGDAGAAQALPRLLAPALGMGDAAEVDPA